MGRGGPARRAWAGSGIRATFRLGRSRLGCARPDAGDGRRGGRDPDTRRLRALGTGGGPGATDRGARW